MVDQNCLRGACKAVKKLKKEDLISFLLYMYIRARLFYTFYKK